MNKRLKLGFWVLLAVNVAIFVLMQLGLLWGEPKEPALSALNADKILLQQEVASAVVAVQPVSTPEAAATASQSAEPVCMEWGEFAGADLEQAETALKKLELGDRLTSREVDHSIGYWVYIAPLKDKAAIAQKVSQLKARGVTDYFVVQEAGEWQNAISLGVFKNHDSAQSFLAGLHAKNVHSAQMGERTGKNKSKVFIINGLDDKLRGDLNVLQKKLSGSELKVTSCH